MPEKPILFNTAMVRATLDGLKTQDSQLVTRLRGFGKITKFQPSDTPGCDWMFMDKRFLWNDISHKRALAGLPYQVGDTLWVRETWAHCQPILTIKKTDGRTIQEISDGYAEYKADGFDTIQDLKDHRRLVSGNKILVKGDKWCPSIHMPRWVARIFLEVTNVRVERLQEISEENAIAEGIFRGDNGRFADYPSGETVPGWKNPIESFRTLWDSINSKRAPWESNPVVAVYEFKRA